MSEPIVDTCNGKICGSIERSILDESFYAFKGIPYANPPVAQLRFQDPIATESWNGIKDATNFGPKCAQFNVLQNGYAGSDDCLYLNVYSKCIDSAKRQAVMVWIHGGGFVCGEGDDSIYGPDYFLRKDVVFVTINYRVGILGFLNLEDELAPGNQGLKDQVMALKWVQDNILNFGGNPDNVTIIGESAGSASVHYLCISTLAKGLFHKAIAQSGVALNPWANVTHNPKELVYRFCELLGNKTRNHKEIVEFLRTIDCSKLMEIQEKLLTPLERLQFKFGFGPGIDKKSKNPFLDIHPEEASKQGVQVPLLIGSTDREGIAFLGEMFIGKQIDEFNTNFDKCLHPTSVELLKKYNLSPEDLKYMYCKNEVLNKDSEGLVDLLGDMYFVEGIQRIVKIQVEKSCAPTYLYRYSHDNQGKAMMKMFSNTTMKGASHADELPKLFHTKMMAKIGIKPLQKGTPEFRIMEQMTEMWTNFAKTGTPTPYTNELIPFYWRPVCSGSILRYLNIDEELHMQVALNLEQHYTAH